MRRKGSNTEASFPGLDLTLIATVVWSFALQMKGIILSRYERFESRLY